MRVKETASGKVNGSGRGKGKGKGKLDLDDDMQRLANQSQAVSMSDESTVSKDVSKRRGPLGKKLSETSSVIEVGLDPNNVSARATEA
jgi:hypothetical protein